MEVTYEYGLCKISLVHAVGFSLKVEFCSMSVIVAVQTRGLQSNAHWTTQFRLELSQDCVTFSPLLDVAGFNVVTYFLLNMLDIELYKYIFSNQ